MFIILNIFGSYFLILSYNFFITFLIYLKFSFIFSREQHESLAPGAECSSDVVILQRATNKHKKCFSKTK